MKKVVAVLLALTMTAGLAACGGKSGESSGGSVQEASGGASESAQTEPEADAGADNPYAGMTVEVLAKGFSLQFWKTVKSGAEQAAEDYGIEMHFEGPGSESDIDEQLNQFNAALAKNPSAIALAALDTTAVLENLNTCKEEGIPVIGFDSGVPGAPEGAIAANASTDNEAAAGLAAEMMMEDESFKSRIEAATAADPVVVVATCNDAISASSIDRLNGYIQKLTELVDPIHPGGVAVTGHTTFAKPADGDTIVEINVPVPPQITDADIKNTSETYLGIKNLIGVFCANEGMATGILNATADGSELGEGGMFEDLVVAGFDAGATQKNAVRQGWFLGSVTQDPFNEGYMAVELALKAAAGEPVSDVDTGAKWYTAENMDDPEIAPLLYD